MRVAEIAYCDIVEVCADESVVYYLDDTGGWSRTSLGYQTKAPYMVNAICNACDVVYELQLIVTFADAPGP